MPTSLDFNDFAVYRHLIGARSGNQLSDGIIEGEPDGYLLPGIC